MEHFRLFVLPFWLGALFLLVALLYKYILLFVKLEPAQRRMFFRSLPTRATLRSLGEIASESLLHRKIWRRNKLLGYMHTSFALGWFLLIVVGWTETLVYFKGENVPLYVDIFFSYYVHPIFEHNFNFSLIKDALLLLILVGVGLAWFKRIRSRAMGMRRTTKHVLGDRIALSALWLIFPARLLAESMTSAVVWRFGGIVWALGEEHHLIPPGTGCGSFLTHTTGELLAAVLPDNLLRAGELPCWWLYSIALGVFFVALPFSRYMHIFTEIPLIFLRNAGLRSGERPSSYDRFQTDACSRCGICIDPCQLQRAGIHGVQAVYFLRDRRYGKLTDAVADNCLMCGRCERACPVGIEQNTLRLNSRQQRAVPVGNNRYGYAQGVDRSQGEGRVGYFAGCMTLLTPKILHAMERIFEAAGEPVWWADKDGGVCCGRPLKLSGEIDAARVMMESNRELFRKHGITTLVTSCPICLRVFREDYDLPGIEVLHHSEYIERLIAAGRLKPQTGGTVYTYHDPCELGRGCGVYDAPRGVIGRIGRLTEPEETRENALCCGSSVANLAMERIFEAAGEPVWWADKDGGVCCGRPLKLSGEIDAARVMMESNRELFRKHGITTLVTSCPICLRVFREDYDLPGIEVLHHSEYIERLIAAGRLKPQTGGTVYTYHDPCELGRGCGVYDAPRGVIGRIGRLTEPEETRENALCCGSSVANLAIDDDGQRRIGESVAASLAATGAEAVVTACPLCKKAIARGGSLPVYDLSEIVAKAL